MTKKQTLADLSHNEVLALYAGTTDSIRAQKIRLAEVKEKATKIKRWINALEKNKEDLRRELGKPRSR